MERWIRTLSLAAALAALAPAAHAQLAGSSWPMYHGGPTHRGTLPAPSLAAPSLAWTVPTADSIFASSPAIGADGTVFVGSTDSTLIAVRPTGAVLWRFKAGGPLYESSPAVAADGTVYVGAMDSTFYAVSFAGTLRWKVRVGSTVRSSPVIAADGTVVFGSGDNHLYAYHPDGTPKWTFPTGANVRSSPALGPDGTVYVGSDDGHLYAIDPATGLQRWAFNLSSTVDMASPTVGPDTTLYIGTTSGLLYAVRPNGTLKWAFSTKHPMYTPPAVLPGGDVVYTAGSDVVRLRAADGGLVWRFTASGLMRTAAAVTADSTLYVGSENDTLYALTAQGARRWTFGAPLALRSSPAVDAAGNVYFGCADGALRMLGAPPLAVAPRAAAAGLALSAPAPNPLRDGATVTFRAPQAGTGTLDVIGVDGRRVRRLYVGPIGPEARQVRWDARDDGGAPLPAGLYWVTLSAGDRRATRRAVVVR